MKIENLLGQPLSGLSKPTNESYMIKENSFGVGLVCSSFSDLVINLKIYFDEDDYFVDNAEIKVYGTDIGFSHIPMLLHSLDIEGLLNLDEKDLGINNEEATNLMFAAIEAAIADFIGKLAEIKDGSE